MVSGGGGGLRRLLPCSGSSRTDKFVPCFYRYPVILDAVIQSNGLGFIGTDRSTFSILSMRRNKDWQNGATRMVLWGQKDADAHRRSLPEQSL